MNIAETKEAFRRRARAGIPFNPVTGAEYAGGNLVRLQNAMQSQGWKDPRFVTQADAERAGWSVDLDGGPDVEAVVLEQGQRRIVELYGAAHVAGMPSLETMLSLDEDQFARMMGQEPQQQAPQAAQPAMEEAEVDGSDWPVLDHGDDVEIGPAVRALDQVVEQGTAQPAASLLATALDDSGLDDEDVTIGPAPLAPARTLVESEQPAHAEDKDQQPESGTPREQAGPSVKANAAPGAALPPTELSGDLAVMAPYFLDGLHNFDGIKMADEINRLVAAQKLSKNREAITLLMGSFPNARRLGLEIVTAEKLRENRLLKDNPSEPATLLDGALARDKEGSYRPAAGGNAVLQDKGSALVLKNRSDQAYRGAMELAKAKGWAAIELKGKPKMLAQAWVEAKLMGLEVVNYKPTEADRERLAQRMAQEAQKREKETKAAEAVPEVVEVIPVVDATGKQLTATATHRVHHAGAAPATAGVGAQEKGAPVVTSTVTRIGDVVREEVAERMPDPGMGPGEEGSKEAASKAVAAAPQQVTQALNEASASAKAVAASSSEPAVLVKHGPAPYDNQPKNRMSYFATLRNAVGVERTIWGVDLARSLGEAGAEVGDTIKLQENGRQPVAIEGAGGPGGAGKVGQRVRWETAVLAKAVQAAPKIETVATGQHFGPIMKIEGALVGQKTGRDPERLSWHDAARLKGGVPAVGEWAEIGYSNGVGTVKVRDQEREQGLGR
jgi:uncharacterized protein GlcG (DUF336 family)